MGGSATATLFPIYFIHFIASFTYHLLPHKWTRFLDVSMINLLIMERAYLITGKVSIYFWCMVSMLLSSITTLEDKMVLVLVAAVVFVVVPISFYYLWAMVGIFFWISCEFQERGDRFMTMMTCVVYHLYLTLLSAMEVKLYNPTITNTTDGFIRYCSYFFFVSIVMIHMTKNPRRLRSILSLLTAIVLSPLSIHQIYKQLQYGATDVFLGDQEIQYFMANYYLAYTLVDTIVGLIYYPEYFTFLEGYLHHICTALFIYYSYYVSPEKRIFICMEFIVEIPSTVLFVSRVFYDIEWIQEIRKKVFRPIFFVFRIFFPILIVIHLHNLMDVSAYIIFSSFTILNFYWLIKMSKNI
jgi:hypothetical protein